MFPCLQGETFWPLTASVGFFRAPVDKVTRSVVPWGRASPWVRSEYDALDRALQTHAPFGSVHTMFLLPSGNGMCTTVLGTDFLAEDFVDRLAARAYYDLGCEFAGCAWRPATPIAYDGAVFAHLRASPRTWGRWAWLAKARPDGMLEDFLATGSPFARRIDRMLPSREQDLRTVYTGETGGYFSASGEPRAFEEPAYYDRPRTVDRLPRELLARYMAAAGVAVDDPAWWDGHVIVAAQANRTPFPHEQPVDPDDMWSTMQDLRRLCRYPPDGIPKELVPPKRGRKRPAQAELDPRERLLARIGNINDFTRPRPLVTLQEFFEGNDDRASIGYNLPDAPVPENFYELLSAIARRPEVADVRIQVQDLEDPDGWPSTDTIWIFTSADVDTVRTWFPDYLAPDELSVSDRLDPSAVQAYEIPAGTRAISAWYD